jgi:hypothetical protein
LSILHGHPANGSRLLPARAAIGALAAASFILLGLMAMPAFASGTLNMSPSHGTAGVEITLGGTGFQPSTAVTVTFNGVVEMGLTTDSTGAFTGIFDAPNVPPGPYPVTANDGVNKVTISFTIDPSSGGGPPTPPTTTTATSTTSSSTGPTGGSKTTTVTTTLTSVSTFTFTIIGSATPQTQTQTSTSTSTTTVTSVSTKTPAALTVTATTTVDPAAVTVTATHTTTTLASAFGGIPNAFLYLFAGVGVLILAISAVILSISRSAADRYGKALGTKKAT